MPARGLLTCLARAPPSSYRSSRAAGAGASSPTAPAFVQGASTIGSSLTLPKAVTAGDLLVAGITTNDSGPTPSPGSPTAPTAAWTRATSLAYGNGHVDLYYLQNSKAGSLTVALAGSGGGALTVAEYSGIATSAALDQVSSATGSGSALKAGPTATIGGAGELVVGLGGQSNVGSGLTAGSGFTLRESAVSNWWAVNGLEDSLSTSSSGQSMTMTSGSAQYFGAVVAVFKAAERRPGPAAALNLSPGATPGESAGDRQRGGVDCRRATPSPATRSASGTAPPSGPRARPPRLTTTQRGASTPSASPSPTASAPPPSPRPRRRWASRRPRSR